VRCRILPSFARWARLYFANPAKAGLLTQRHSACRSAKKTMADDKHITDHELVSSPKIPILYFTYGLPTSQRFPPESAVELP
jgi:hypothetical protein